MPPKALGAPGLASTTSSLGNETETNSPTIVRPGQDADADDFVSHPDEIHDDEKTTRASAAVTDVSALEARRPMERSSRRHSGDRGRLDVGFILLASAAGWAAIAAIVGLVVLIARLLF